MEEKLKTYLRPGEQVRWQGQPAPFPLLEGKMKTQILTKWIVTAVLGAALLAVYLTGNEEPSMGFVGLVALVMAVILASPFMERRNLQGMRYWVTDQRVILLTRDQTFYYMELAKIDGYQVLDGAAAEKCLVLGSCLFEEAARRLRWRACHPKTDIQGHDHPDQAMGMILYGLRDVEAVEKLLRQRHIETVA